MVQLLYVACVYGLQVKTNLDFLQFIFYPVIYCYCHDKIIACINGEKV